jgi:hypothetical protein
MIALALGQRRPEVKMTPDRSYITENDRERRRLEALVEKLDDRALSQPMPAGLTVAAVLAHLASGISASSSSSTC